MAINKQFKVPVNLLNAPTDPIIGHEGDIYYNTTTNVIRLYKNGAWEDILASSTVEGSPGYYGAFHDTTTQNIVSTTTAYKITMNSTDESNGISRDVADTSKIRFAHAGTYSLTFSIQLINTNNSIKNANVWFKKGSGSGSASDIPYSNSQTTVPNSHGELPGQSILTVNLVATFAADDYVQLYWQGESTALSIETIAAGTTPTTPVTPSIIFTVVQVASVLTGGGGGASVLDDLTDVVQTDVTDNEVLAYDTASSKWINQTASEAGLAKINSQTFTGTVVLPSTTSIGLVDSSEILYLNGVSSNIQDQLDSKLSQIDADTLYQPLEARLTSLSNISGSPGFTRYDGDGTFSVDTNIYLTTTDAETMYLSQTDAAVTYQPLDQDLTDISSLTANGILRRTSGVCGMDNTSYLTTSTAASTYQPIGSYLVSSDLSGYLTTSSASSTYQPLDADLTAIAGITETSGLLKKTASNTWVLDTNTYATTGDISSAVGDYIPLSQKGDPQGVAELDIDGFVPVSQLPDLSSTYLTVLTASTTYQPKDQDLTDIAALTANGILKRTAGVWGMDTSTYLTSYTETDPIFTASAAYGITSTNITNWNTAYTDRNKWDGGATGLTASTGRTSLGATTVGNNLFTLTNPSAITFLKINADNTVTAESASTHRTSLGLAIGTNVQAYSATLTGIDTLGSGTGLLKNTAGTWSYDTSTYLTGSNVHYIGTTSIALNRESASQSLTGITSIDGSAASLTTSRTLWGQSFNGTANITGNLTSVGNITGTGAVVIQSGGTNNNMTVKSVGTGNAYLDTATSSGSVYIGSTATYTYMKNIILSGGLVGTSYYTSGQGGTTPSSGISINTGYQSGTAVTGDITISTGDASGNASGNIGIDSGTAGTTAGTINIGTTNSPTINIGRTGSTTTINGTFNTTAINGTTIPSSKILVVTTDIGSSVQAYDADLTSIAALTGTSGFLKTNGAGTWTVDTNTYALNSALSSYAALSGATFTGNIAVNNGTSTAITTTGTTAAVFNTNATTLNIGGAATTVSIGDTAHGGTTTINNNLSVYGSITFSQGASSLSATTIQIDDTLISLADNNIADILDIGFYAGYQPASTPLHTGLARDASDSKWKLFSGVSVQPTATIDFTGATYDTLKIGTLEVTDASTTRSNLGLIIGTNVQAYSATLAGINTLGSGTGFLKNTAGTWSYDNSTYLTTSSASSTYAPLASPTFTGTVTIPAGASISGYLTTSSASSNYQPLDADLTAIAALTGTTGILKKTAADTWALDTSTYLTSAVTSIIAGTGLSGGTITSTGTIALATAYGDTTNPYASKTANYVLASPNGTAGVPTFRALVAADIPSLSYAPNAFSTIATTSGTSPVADSTTDTLTLSAGSGISVTGDSTTDTITIANTGYYSGSTDVALADGGTNASLTASNGGIVYSTDSAMAILSGTATAGKYLQSGSTEAPSWTTSTYADTYAVNTILYAGTANTITGLATANSSVLVTSGTGVPSWSTTLPAVTLTTPTINTINTSFTTTGTAALFNTGITTGTISIGGALTTGTINIGSGTAGAKTINIGTSTGSVTLDGTVNVATLDLSTAATATTATSYFVETGDGVVKPKTLANVKTEVVTTAAVNSAAATTVGTVTSGTWNASIIGATYGGTGNGFTAFTGPTTSTKTFTLPNASAAILTDNAVVTAVQGGTGQTGYTVGDILYASTSTALSKLSATTSGYVLTSNGSGVAPSWQAVTVPSALTASSLMLDSRLATTTYTGTTSVTDSGSAITATATNPKSVEYTIFISNGTNSYTSKLLVLMNGSTPITTEYGILQSSTSFGASISVAGTSPYSISVSGTTTAATQCRMSRVVLSI